MAVLYRIICIVLLFGLSACSPSEPPQGHDAPVVGVFAVFEKKLRLSQTYPGRVVAYNTAEIRPQVSGIILARSFTEGAVVQEGDTLYTIDPAPYEAELKKAQAKERNLAHLATRRKQLIAHKAVSRQEYEDAHYQWQQAKAELVTAQLNLRYCTVKAPLQGKVGKSDITMGALVVADQPLPMTTIHQIDPVYVDIYPAIRQIGSLLANGEEAFKTITAGLTIEGSGKYSSMGSIQFVDNHVKEETSTLGIRLAFANPKGALLPGMFVRATLLAKEPQPYLLIPQQAVFRDSSGKTQVWVVKDDNSVELRPVSLGQALGNVWVVEDGVVLGEKLITEGLLRVRAGGMVSPKDAENVNISYDFTDAAESWETEQTL